MPTLVPGDVWVVDFGMLAKVRPALLPTGPLEEAGVALAVRVLRMNAEDQLVLRSA